MEARLPGSIRQGRTAGKGEGKGSKEKVPALPTLQSFHRPQKTHSSTKNSPSHFRPDMDKPEDDRPRLSPKQKGVSSSSSSVFGRSFTMHSQPTTDVYLANHPTLERAGSIRNFYTSFSSLRGKVNKLRSLFETPKSALPPDHLDPPPSSLSLPSSKLWPAKSISPPPSIRLPGTEDRIVVYFTSLHGIRRTYEDCYSVRMIFRGFRVQVDERDVSMDLEYKRELQGVLGERTVSLPQVFIGGRYVGGSDAITRLYETGELAKLIDRFPRIAPGFVCKGCGDVRFVPCANCSGSRKVFDEDDGQLRRCLECNENGLVRCPDCCS